MEGDFGARGLSMKDCLRYKGVNNRILLNDLASGAADVVVIQERDAVIMERDRSGVTREEVTAELRKNYDFVGEVPHVGQFGETAWCFARKPGVTLRGR
jgi:hypothetical protein